MPPRPILASGLLARVGCSHGALPIARVASLASLARGFTATTRDASKSTTEDDGSAPPRLPPESPRYINIPTPPQSEEIRYPPRRGHLPVPRNIFHSRKSGSLSASGAHHKANAVVWTAKAAPRSQAELRGEPPRNERDAWRRRLAESRRQSLQAGLSGLWRRQKQRVRHERARAAGVAERNRKAALENPERLDDVLTRSSVRDATAKVTAVLRDPHRHERQAESAARTAALAQLKRESRRDALMELYQAAGKFIVDEQELQKRVDELFRPDYFKDEGYSYGSVNAENIWDVMGKPSTVQDMMSGITRTETKLYDSRRTEVDRTTKRQKMVAEALTGGKMP